jgi:hypothetical protein
MDNASQSKKLCLEVEKREGAGSKPKWAKQENYSC